MFVQRTLAPPKVRETSLEHLPWVEKYRPQRVEELSHQEEVVSALLSSLQSSSLPHLLFYGPPGTGKTSAILALSKQLFGPDIYKSRVLELNASDDRGIGMVREKIKKFAQIAVTKGTFANSPSFKIIILDEADSLTNDAQAALRRVIEKYTKVTRFCIICNYISKIIDPLTSRCAKFRFKPISAETHRERLEFICSKEDVNLTNTAFECLIKISDGDLRRSITTLQSASKLFKGFITEDNIREVAAIVPDNVVTGIFRELAGNNVGLLRCAEEVMHSGYPPDGVILQLFDLIVGKDEISDYKKAKIEEILAEADYGLVAGGNEYLQVLKTLTSIQKILRS